MDFYGVYMLPRQPIIEAAITIHPVQSKGPGKQDMMVLEPPASKIMAASETPLILGSLININLAGQPDPDPPNRETKIIFCSGETERSNKGAEPWRMQTWRRISPSLPRMNS